MRVPSTWRPAICLLGFHIPQVGCVERPADEPIAFRLHDQTGWQGDAAAFGDVDGDGREELMTVGESSWVLSWDDGQYARTELPFSRPTLRFAWVSLGDLDNDGDLDVVLDDPKHPVWLNDGAGQFTELEQEMLVGDEEPDARSGELADLDADGDLDLVQGNFAGNRVWLNDGTGRFEDSGQTLGGDRSVATPLADVDRDGDVDVLVADIIEAPRDAPPVPGPVPDRIWLNDGEGRFTDSGQRLATDDGFLSTAAAFGDVDADGDVDAVVGGTGSGIVWLNDGTGVFTQDAQQLDMRESRWLQLVDLGGDGDLDIVSADTAQGMLVWANNGSGGFDAVELLQSAQDEVSRTGVGGVAGDVDADGDIDVVLLLTGPIEIWLNER